MDSGENYIKINLSKILGEKRITMRQLSLTTGIRNNTISDLYHEKAKFINIEHLLKICEILEIQISDLLEIVPKEKLEAPKQ